MRDFLRVYPSVQQEARTGPWEYLAQRYRTAGASPPTSCLFLLSVSAKTCRDTSHINNSLRPLSQAMCDNQ